MTRLALLPLLFLLLLLLVVWLIDSTRPRRPWESLPYPGEVATSPTLAERSVP